MEEGERSRDQDNEEREESERQAKKSRLEETSKGKDPILDSPRLTEKFPSLAPVSTDLSDSDIGEVSREFDPRKMEEGERSRDQDDEERVERERQAKKSRLEEAAKGKRPMLDSPWPIETFPSLAPVYTDFSDNDIEEEPPYFSPRPRSEGIPPLPSNFIPPDEWPFQRQSTSWPWSLFLQRPPEPPWVLHPPPWISPRELPLTTKLEMLKKMLRSLPPIPQLLIELRGISFCKLINQLPAERRALPAYRSKEYALNLPNLRLPYFALLPLFDRAHVWWIRKHRRSRTTEVSSTAWWTSSAITDAGILFFDDE